MTQPKVEKIKPFAEARENVMGGALCLSGTRIPAETLYDNFDRGWTIKDMTTKLWPHLKGREKDIVLCIELIKDIKHDSL